MLTLTFSWLAADARGPGFGREMRKAALHLALGRDHRVVPILQQRPDFRVLDVVAKVFLVIPVPQPPRSPYAPGAARLPTLGGGLLSPDAGSLRWDCAVTSRGRRPPEQPVGRDPPAIRCRSAPFVVPVRDHAVVDEKVANRRGSSADRLEPDGRQPFEQPLPACGDRRRDDEPELIDDASSKQRPSDRDAAVNADVAAGPTLQPPHEVDQPAVDSRASCSTRVRAASTLRRTWEPR
jgi:hypothetical protein